MLHILWLILKFILIVLGVLLGLLLLAVLLLLFCPVRYRAEIKKKETDPLRLSLIHISALGYSAADAMRAVRQVTDVPEDDVESILKAALKNL